MYLLGYDVGTSSVKASLVDVETGKCKATCFWPEKEAPIIANKPGWAEQEPEMWWENLKVATSKIMAVSHIRRATVWWWLHRPRSRTSSEGL